MNKTGKVWGSTSELFTNNNVSIHRIDIAKNKKCSKHLHRYKYNMFFVESGKIIVRRWEQDYTIDTILDSQNSITIEPNIYHQFESLEDSIVYEIYYTKLDNNDIVRN